MIGPRALAKLKSRVGWLSWQARPFLKVEATKFTEVGYVGRDVEQIIRDLVEISISLTRESRRKDVETAAEKAAEDRILDALVGQNAGEATRIKFRAKLLAGRT